MMGLTLYMCAVLSCVSADPAPVGYVASKETRLKFADLCEQYRLDRIQDNNGAIQYWRTQMKLELKQPPQSKQQRKYALDLFKGKIKKLEDENKLANEPGAFLTPILPYDVKIGDIGRIAGKTTIRQVVDEENLLVEGYIGAERDSPLGAPYESPRWKSEEITVWIEGLPTDGMTDGSELKTDKIFEVYATKKYDTTGGSTKTILILRKLSFKDGDELIEETIRKAREARAKSKPARKAAIQPTTS